MKDDEEVFEHESYGMVSVSRLSGTRGVPLFGSSLEANRERDQKNLARLQAEGWRVLVIWECELHDLASLTERVAEFLKEAP